MRDILLKRQLVSLYEFIYERKRRITRELRYGFNSRKYRLRIMNSEKTIEYILRTGCSIARFGDGEFDMIFGVRDLKFQRSSDALGNKLEDVLKNRNPKLLLCIPGTFKTIKGCNWHAAMYWTRWGITENRLQPIIKLLRKCVDNNYRFGDAQITRPYIDWDSPKRAEQIFPKLKQLWDKRDILIVEGEQTRLGVGNDLFENAKSIKRVLAPATGAFESYEQIKQTVLGFYNGELIIAALGPTATILASDFANMDIQTLDLGHIDIEYEWFLSRAKEKTNIYGKYVNEVIGGQGYTECLEPKYLNEIVVRINC